MDTNILETIDVHQLGIELQKARKQRGMTQEESAKLIGVARTTITAIEKGERQIRSTELVKLAHAYGRQIGDFVRSRPSIEPFRLQFRGPYQPNAKEAQEIEQARIRLEELCRDYLELEEIVGSAMVRNYPREYSVSGLKTDRAAESVAIEERNRLGLGDSPIPMLREILEQEVGLRIFYLQLPSRFSEMYHYDEQLGGCLAVNALHPSDRRRLSLAHGYAHFLVNRYKATTFIEGSFDRSPEDEHFAGAFAQYLLMPTSSIFRRFNALREKENKVTIVGVLMLANYYGVSLEAMTRRLEDMRLLPTSMWDKIQASGLKVRETQHRLGIEELNDKDDQLPVRYKYLAFDALERELITEGQFARFLGVDRVASRTIALELRKDVGLGGRGTAGLDTALKESL